MRSQLYFVHALSPLHAGVGQGSGVIDLPIAREKATGIPYVPGSSVKGVLRDRSASPQKVAIFGPETANASDHAGALQVGDARLLALPVRSLAGTFAWATSPYLLQRLVRDVRGVSTNDIVPAIPVLSQKSGCLVTKTSILKMIIRQDTKVILEDLDLNPESANANDWGEWIATHACGDDAALQQMLKQRLCIIHDDVLTFLFQTALEITARIRLDEQKKTVVKGALWNEESLPTESLLVGIMVSAPTIKVPISDSEVFSEVRTLAAQTLQFGGKSTVGRGVCQLRTAGA